VFFETCGDRLGIDGLTNWMGRFGLGRPTGIGVGEANGRLPGQVHVPAYLVKSVSWFGGIGQGKVAATPIQMANVSATIARDGVWMRPRLVPSGEPLPKQLRSDGIPERVDLNLNPEAMRLAKIGMNRVVNTRAGSGTALHRDDIVICGKTGTAQAAPFTYRKRDENGNLVKDAEGNVVREELRLSTAGNPNPMAPWYRGTGQSGQDRAHAWFIGFAPAERPKIAFCVLVEYGGGGGIAAAPIARDIVQACVDAGYLEGRRSGEKEVSRAGE
jgi:penicillin-binding protein 2